MNDAARALFVGIAEGMITVLRSFKWPDNVGRFASRRDIDSLIGKLAEARCVLKRGAQGDLDEGRPVNETERDLLLTAVDALDGLLSSHAAEAVRRARGESLTADEQAVERQVLFATLRRLRRATGPVTAEAALDGDSKATGDDEAKP